MIAFLWWQQAIAWFTLTMLIIFVGMMILNAVGWLSKVARNLAGDLPPSVEITVEQMFDEEKKVPNA